MSYINFKEEKAKASIQLEHRKNNNYKIYKYIMKNKESLVGYSPDNKYSFKNIKKRFIGKKGIVGINEFCEISNKDIICTKFIECEFSNIKFIGCKFIGCVFENCDFDGGGIIFEDCIFYKQQSDKIPSLNRKDNLSCEFYRCKMYIKVINSNMSYCIFEDSKIYNSSFEDSDMKSMLILKSEMNKIEIIDCDFSGLKILKTYVVDFCFEDKNLTKFNENTFFDKLMIRTKTKQEYEGLYMIYQVYADKFKDNNLENNFGEYYYLAKNIERKCVDKLIPKLNSHILWLTCGYGERPSFCLFSSVGIILLFSFIYLIIGIDISGEVIKYSISNITNINIRSFILHYNEALNLSVGMFGGVGISNSKPTEIAYIVSNIEMLLGITMMGVAIGTLTRKIIR